VGTHTIKCRIEENGTLYYTNSSVFSDIKTLTVTSGALPYSVDSGPSGTQTSSAVEFFMTASHTTTCHYDTVSRSFSNMIFSMGGNVTSNHTVTLNNLADGPYKYYIRCQNTDTLATMKSDVTVEFDVDTRTNFNIIRPNVWREYLATGWNGFLLTLKELQNTTLSEYNTSTVLSSVNGNYEIIYYNPGENASTWKSYIPGEPSNDLTQFDDQTGYRPYYIYMNTTDRIEIN